MKLKCKKTISFILILAVGLIISAKLASQRDDGVGAVEGNVVLSSPSFVAATNTSNFTPKTKIEKKGEYRPDSGGATAMEIDHGLRKLDKAWKEPPEVQDAKKKGASGKVTLHIIDTHGKSVPEAEVFGGFYTWAEDNPPVKGKTDNEGTISFEQICTGDFNFSVSKNGYYTTTLRYWLYKRGFDCVRDGRWLPWNPTLEVVLKEERKPIPMYVKTIKIVLPDKDTAYGFDCQIGALVKPYGRGEETDLFLSYSSILSPDDVWSYTNQIVIASTTNGGIQSMALDVWSELKSSHDAPVDKYMPEISFGCRSPNRETRYEIKFTTDTYLVFKSRVVKNEDGEILSVNYGKIYPDGFYYGESSPQGDAGGVVELCYYFNPTPNDRNLEFDGINNLFHPAWNDDSWPRQP